MTYLLNKQVSFQDGAGNDAFGRLRASNPYTLLDAKQIFTNQPYIYDTEISGGSSIYNQSGASSTLSVTGGTGSYVIRQTKQKFNYQSGKSQLVLLTGVFSKETNVIKRVGYFDSSTTAPFTAYCGLFLEVGNDGLSVNIAKNGSIRKILQSDWNIDTMTGAGPSKVVLDMTKSQILVMDAEWLGVGRVRFGFNIDGKTYHVHEFNNANNIVGVYTQYLNLPIRYEIRSIGGNGSLEQICATVGSEGGLDPTGIFRTVKRSTTLAINNGIFRPVLAIRLKPGGSIGTIILDSISILNTSKSDFYYCVKLYSGTDLVNISTVPTVWSTITFTDITNSYCQFKVDFDNTYTVNETINNGLEPYGSFVPSTFSSVIGSPRSALHMGAKINGLSDVVVIEIKSLTANDTYYTSLTFREL